MKILVLCTGNSCRSQMAEGFLKFFHPDWEVFSAGTKPAGRVNHLAVRVMLEKGIDITGKRPKSIDPFLDQEFDYVVTVCDNARETCPVFTGKVSHRIHIGFEDPSDSIGTDEEVLPVYRKVRDQIESTFLHFPD